MCLQFYRTGFPNLWATDWYVLWDQQRYKLRNEMHSMQYAWIILKPSPFPGPYKDDFHKTGPWCQRCWGPLMLSGFSHILHKGCDTAFVKLRQWFLFSLSTLWTCTNTRIQSFCLCIKHFIRKRFIKSAESRSLPSRKLYYQFSSVTQSSLTLCDPMDCSLPGSSVHGILQEEYWSGLPFPLPGDLPNPGIELKSLASPALQVGSSPLSHLIF